MLPALATRPQNALAMIAARVHDAASYRAVGYALAGLLADELRPLDVGPAEWRLRVATLAELLDDGDAAAALAWFHREFPAGMELVPQQRRRAFLAGVVEAADEGVLDLAGW